VVLTLETDDLDKLMLPLETHKTLEEEQEVED
jgi:hypothetical protein